MRGWNCLQPKKWREQPLPGLQFRSGGAFDLFPVPVSVMLYGFLCRFRNGLFLDLYFRRNPEADSKTADKQYQGCG
jgi:hypothetical protein